MLRLITCQRATLLIEQRTDQPPNPTDRNSLWLHLRYCPYCNRYARQTQLIAELALKIGAATGAASLSAEARQRIQERLLRAQDDSGNNGLDDNEGNS